MNPFIRLAVLAVLAAAPLRSGGKPAAVTAGVTIQAMQNLDYGELLVGQGGGSATLTPDGSLILLGPGLRAGGRPAGAAKFQLYGPPRAAFTLQVSPLTPLLSNPAGGAIILAQFLPSLPRFSGSFNALGQASFNLGGRLDIGPGLRPGLYSNLGMRLQLTVSGLAGNGAFSLPFQVSARLQAPLQLFNTGPLDFGVILAGTQPGTFQVQANGWYRSSAANGPALLKATPLAAVFSLNGVAGASYCIQLPNWILLTGPGEAMRVQDFTCSISPCGTLPAGSVKFQVGASLVVPPEQKPGRYSGVFAVTVDYP